MTEKKVPNPYGKKGLPVKRERDVIEEVENDKNIQVEFHAYNVEEDKDNDGSSD
jgi:hypothetical protein